MPVNVGSITMTGGTSLTVTDSSSNKIYQQNTSGQVIPPRTSGGSILTPMFNVGWDNVGWSALGGTPRWCYTAGSGYTNIGNCYDTSNGRFTAPWTGIYLFRFHIYSYGGNSTYTWYYHPLYMVNGSSTLRRPGGTPYRIRNYGMHASYGQDSDCAEMIYLTAGDYVTIYCPRSGEMDGLTGYSTFAGCYLGT